MAEKPQMKIVWKNTNLPKESDGHFSVPCEVCGVFKFTFNHLGCYELPIGWNMAAYDYPYWVCSKECDGKCLTEGLKNKRHIDLSISFSEMYDTAIPAFIKRLLGIK